MISNFKNFWKKNYSITNTLLLTIFLVGLIITFNIMLRYDKQIFSCSFWLLCPDEDTFSVKNNYIFQLFTTIFVLGILLISFFKLGSQTKTNLEKYFSIAAFALISLSIGDNIWSILSNSFNLFLQGSLSLSLLIVLLLWFVECKYAFSKYKINPVNPKTFIILLISSGLMMFFGVLISITDSARVCTQFPICFPTEGISFEVVLVNLHRFFTLTTAIFITKALQISWRRYRNNKSLLVSITIGFTIFIGQSFIGGIQVFRNLPIDLLFIHSASSVVYILAVLYAFTFTRYVEKSNVSGTATILNDSQRRKDFLILNKPIIVALLLVTTYAGMVVGGGKIPEFSLTIWTLLGGALAAGGSSAINQFIDIEIDRSMQRTAKRPLPSGRLEPAEALALGVSEVILSFYIFVSFVNLNAALLAMFGMVYYVFIYSKWLKKITVQNIVIGGGAGAIPPLVGWAAATGGLNIPSIFLFALVFLWTPPHFWALALVRKNDYARASIPMLPVVKGEKKTRLHILIYTIQLVLLTLLMPLFGIGGSFYWVLAIILGLWLLSIAWQVYKLDGNKIAFKMYRYSSMYLAFIFLALVIDVLI